MTTLDIRACDLTIVSVVSNCCNIPNFHQAMMLDSSNWQLLNDKSVQETYAENFSIKSTYLFPYCIRLSNEKNGSFVDLYNTELFSKNGNITLTGEWYHNIICLAPLRKISFKWLRSFLTGYGFSSENKDSKNGGIGW